MSAFGASCAVSWARTGRYQWELGVGGVGRNYSVSFYLRDYYYQGGYDAAAVVGFAVDRTWGLLQYHMPTVIAWAALLAFVALLASSLTRRRLDAPALLALFAVGIAICAALLGAYPYGGIRQCFYLGPIIFLAAGSGFHSVAVEAGAIARRRWLAPALGIAAAGAIAIAGAGAVRMRQDYLYYSDPSMKQVIAAVEELEREGDAVYVSRREALRFKFYKPAKPDNYLYGHAYCPGADWTVCVPEMLDEMFRALGDSRRIWLIHNASASVPKEMAAHSREGAAVEEFAAHGRQSDGWPMPHNREPTPHTTVHLITGFERLVANMRKEWLDAVSGAPDVVAAYNLYLRGDTLHYAKRACDAADTEARFFLHLYPEDADGLPARRRQYGFDNLDFDFHNYGMRIDDRCIIRRRLPEYAIEHIHAGQFVLDGGVVWEVELAGEP